ncbi:MAG: LLM class flavin-dependent oxidoreductase [Acidimicrobiales bacterium]
MRVGITLPTFEPTAAAALARSREAELAGIDGVFAFDHLWPGADKDRPALSLFPVLGAVAATTRRLRIGSLVARLGLVPDELVIKSLTCLQELSGGRLVAALGIGDSKSLSENNAYGIPFPSPAARRASLAAMLAALGAAGVETWVGATSPATLEVARAASATVNLWDVGIERLRTEVDRGPTSWAGPLPGDPRAAADRLMELREAGATWAVWGWPRSVELVTQALHLAGIRTSEG